MREPIVTCFQNIEAAKKYLEALHRSDDFVNQHGKLTGEVWVSGISAQITEEDMAWAKAELKRLYP